MRWNCDLEIRLGDALSVLLLPRPHVTPSQAFTHDPSDFAMRLCDATLRCDFATRLCDATWRFVGMRLCDATLRCDFATRLGDSLGCDLATRLCDSWGLRDESVRTSQHRVGAGALSCTILILCLTRLHDSELPRLHTEARIGVRGERAPGHEGFVRVDGSNRVTRLLSVRAGEYGAQNFKV